MSRFFVENKIYKERLSKCKDCEFFFKPTSSCKICGCFMKIKARIANMDCPKGYWKSTDFGFDREKLVSEIPAEFMQEIREVWEHIKTGRADSVESKKRMIEIYNATYNGHFNTNTSCRACLDTCYKGLAKIIEDDRKKNL